MTSKFIVPDDLVALRMENDLLSLEVQHLRGRLASGEGVPADEVERLERELDRAAGHLATERERVAELAQARSDLRWFLQRLDGSPLGPVLRRFGGFRTLVVRWVDA